MGSDYNVDRKVQEEYTKTKAKETITDECVKPMRYKKSDDKNFSNKSVAYGNFIARQTLIQLLLTNEPKNGH